MSEREKERERESLSVREREIYWCLKPLRPLRSISGHLAQLQSTSQVINQENQVKSTSQIMSQNTGRTKLSLAEREIVHACRNKTFLKQINQRDAPGVAPFRTIYRTRDSKKE